MKKQEIADKVFAKHKALKEVFVSDDNHCFASEDSAKLHCKKRGIGYEPIVRPKPKKEAKENLNQNNN